MNALVRHTPRGTRFSVDCSRCGANALVSLSSSCSQCGGLLAFAYARPLELTEANPTLWSYGDWLPVHDPAGRLTLGEGGTPLLAARGDYGCQLWWKDEGRNPTGSHKDRALAVAVSAAREAGVDSIVLASAGSTGLSAAAYAAAAGMRCLVLVPRDTVDARISPLLLYGATVVRFPGSIDDAFQVLASLSAAGQVMDVSTIRRINPFQAEAPRTIAFEIVQQLGDAPDWVVVPTGGGGTLAGIARGFVELRRAGLATRCPALVAVQPSAYNTLERVVHMNNVNYADPRDLLIANSSQTVLSKLAHTFPPDGIEALDAIHTSLGTALSVSDNEALRAQIEIGRTEGLFVEASAAAGPAGLRRLVGQGVIGTRDRVVVCLTGGGFRVQDELDPASLGRVIDGPGGLDATHLLELLTANTGNGRS